MDGIIKAVDDVAAATTAVALSSCTVGDDVDEPGEDGVVDSASIDVAGLEVKTSDVTDALIVADEDGEEDGETTARSDTTVDDIQVTSVAPALDAATEAADTELDVQVSALEATAS